MGAVEQKLPCYLLCNELISNGNYDAVVTIVNSFPILATKELLQLALLSQDCRMISYFVNYNLTVEDFGFLLYEDKYPDARQKIVALLFDLKVNFDCINFQMIRLLLPTEFRLKLDLQLQLCSAVINENYSEVQILLAKGARFPCSVKSNQMFVFIQTIV